MTPEDPLTARVRRAVQAVLPPGLGVRVARRGRRHGGPGTRAFDVEVTAGAVEHHFVAGWAGKGWPAEVDELLELVPDLEVVVASRLSPGAQAIITGRKLGWVDETGGADISRPSGLVVLRTVAATRGDRPAPERWSPSALAAAEAVLSGVPPLVEAVERRTGLSRHATATSLMRLEQLGLLARPHARRGPRAGRVVVDEDRLLTAYTEAATVRRTRQRTHLVHRLWTGDLPATLGREIAPGLEATGAAWAVTGGAASLLLAPYLSEVSTLELYVDRELMGVPARLADLLGGRVVEQGAVITVRELPTVMAGSGPIVDGIRLAVPVRVYADLMAVGGRSAEAAHHLWEVGHGGTES